MKASNNDSLSSIFRASAVQRYQYRYDKAVLPKFIRPNLFLFTWAIFGLLIVAGIGIWLTPVPITLSGTAVVVMNWDKNDQAVSDEVALVVLFPASEADHLSEGTEIVVDFRGEGGYSRSRIMALQPGILSPEEARQQFSLVSGSTPLLNGPVLAVIAPFEPINSDLPDSAYVGTAYEAWAVAGTQRALFLLPFISFWLGQ
jgi:hypothetical protein